MKLRTWIFIILFIALLVMIKIFFLKSDKGKAPAGVKSQKMVVNVTGTIASTQMLDNKLYSSGTILPNEEVVLHPEISGRLVSVFFKEGATVQQGSLLAKINDADLQAQLKKLSYQVQLAGEKSRRLKGLLEIEGVSKEEYEWADNQILTLQADMDYTRAQIAKTEIRAPFSGKIGLRQVSAGSFVNNTTILATIQQTSVLKIEFTLPEKYAALIALNDKIQFTVDNIKDQFLATVYAIEPRIDAETRNINIRALYNNAGSRIIPGSFARVAINAGKDQVSIMIPTEAVIPELKGKKVFVSKNGKAMPVKVETGIRTDTQIEIVSGLSVGDTVIVTGIMSLKPGSEIKIIELKN